MGSPNATHNKRASANPSSMDPHALAERIPEFIIPDTGYDRMIDCIFF